MYGKSIHKNWNKTFSNTQIVENPEMLNIMEEISHKELQPKVSTNTVVNAIPVRKEPMRPITNASTPTNKQIEVRLPDGKRRITPMLLTSTSDTNK